MLIQSKKIKYLLLLTVAVLACACSEEEGGDKVVVVVQDTGADSTSSGTDSTTNEDSTTTATTDTGTGTTDTDTNTDSTDTPECVPLTCAFYNATCGQALDGCGKTINCGNCGFDEDCIDNTCVDIGCRPTQCDIEGVFCGEIPDGCQGDPLNCGDCGGGFLCSTLRQCIPGPDAVCGNSATEFGEECDNGGGNSNFRPDACRRDCTLPRCGDGVTDTIEACDEGSNTIESDACKTDCTPPPHCFPCTSDAQCGTNGHCISGINACAVSCSTADGAAACPTGYTCQSEGSDGTVCMPSQGFCAEICNNGLDDDSDGDADCADTDCEPQTYCDIIESSCTDNFDNDGDGDKDCLDDECDANPACACAGVVCDSPPNGTCTGGDTLNGHELPGTCSPSTGQCSYVPATITCNQPPPTDCAPGNDATRSYADSASDCRSVSGTNQCSYTTTTTDCDSPPARACNSAGNGIVTYTDGDADCVSSGSSAQCAYQATTELCDNPPLAICVGNLATVASQTGTCSGGSNPTCSYTTSIVDCAAQGKVCGATGCEPNVPVVASVDYPVIAHGGKLIITGSRFTGATAVTLGGVSQTFTVDSASQITINLVPDNVPLGNQPLVVSTASENGQAFTVKVIHLVINELDCDQPKENDENDKYEFIEIVTGLNEAINLSGYVLLPIGGDEKTYTLPGFNGQLGTTGTDGILLIGTTYLSVTPDHTFTRDNLQNGADAVAIYQRTSAPNSGTNISSISGNIIDALVYDTDDNSDTGLLDGLIGPSGTTGRTQVDEGDINNSIRRCSGERRNGNAFNQDSTPSPGAPNGCP